MAPTLLAAALALLVHALGLSGTDEAAQSYRVHEVRAYGLVLWDSGWYGGNLPLGYSVVFPLIGALTGLVVAGVASAAAATYAFDRLVVGVWGRRGPASWYMAVSTTLPIAIGQLPYLAGEAFGLLTLLALRQRRPVLAVLAVAASTLCSPLAGAFTALACLAVTADHRVELLALLRRRLGRAATGAGTGRAGAGAGTDRAATSAGTPRTGGLAAIGCAAAGLALIGALALTFPNWGSFPFPVSGFGLTLLFCAVAATPILPAPPVLRWAAAGYALVAVVSFAVPNEVGGNVIRLAQSVGVPTLVALATHGHPPGRASTAPLPRRRSSRRRRLVHATIAFLVVGAFATWQWGPGLGVLEPPPAGAGSTESFYQPLLHQIEQRSSGPVRVEAVPTVDHWESAYLAPTVSLARGWERQLDVTDNPLFYRPGPLRAASYVAWLRANGVTWVALPATELDYASRAEAALLRSGPVAGLRPVWTSAHWRLWRVLGGPGLVSGPGRITRLDPDHLSVSVRRPAVITLRVRYTDLWGRAGSGGSGGSGGGAADCVRRSGGGWTQVVAQQAGTLRLVVNVLGDGGATCPSSPAAAVASRG